MEIKKDLSIVRTKTADHEHDVERCAHGVTGEGKLVKYFGDLFHRHPGIFLPAESLGKKKTFLEHLGLGR